ncbi:MAG: hypothetical protein QXX09_00405 [Candidatus Methanomethylicia archaeon]
MMNAEKELEVLKDKLKSTKRRYKRFLLKSKIDLLETNVNFKEGVKAINEVKTGVRVRLENSMKNTSKRIHESGFKPEESLTEIYSLLDKSSYILKAKPSKFSTFKYYLSRVMSGFSRGFGFLRIYLSSKVAAPPILYSKSYIISMRELRSWHTSLYSRLTGGFRGFKNRFLSYKSRVGGYKSRIDSSRSGIRSRIDSSRAKSKSVAKRFFD